MSKVNDGNIYILNSIQRYNTQHRNHNETVAAHSFFVCYFIHRICSELELDDTVKLYALEAGLLHDVPEVIINDITYDAKCLIKGMSDMLQPYEEDIIKSQSTRSWRVLFSPQNIVEQLAQMVVNHADIISVHQFCENEVSMGNKNFNHLLADSIIRVQESYTTLEALASVYKLKSKSEKEGNNHAKKQ